MSPVALAEHHACKLLIARPEFQVGIGSTAHPVADQQACTELMRGLTSHGTATAVRRNSPAPVETPGPRRRRRPHLHPGHAHAGAYVISRIASTPTAAAA